MSIFTNSAASSKAEAAGYTAAVLGLLGDKKAMTVVGKTERAIAAAIKGITPKRLRTPEMPGKWSIAQVVQHLADSELVWGWRMRLIFTQDRPTITGYDQDAWAGRLDYAHSDTKQALKDFASLRAANIRLLKKMKLADFDRVGVHSERGEESLRHLLNLYAGHDILHLNQIARIKKAVR
jgi:uncharacterized damage-inducible protein DinB